MSAIDTDALAWGDEGRRKLSVRGLRFLMTASFRALSHAASTSAFSIT
jgi:hypothetical protein